eukprot:CAMPEP_0201720144 /NCGR_PEP_ID=MMETSP0593-20130828/5168_1 /ASSEMBLY_ACC=CAM_ASM_000672 /TAXON_ID=267983 /ORGANISM="Skeletonema japonicum, Strain CCMP2506" /LENGTH=269 /DNA_ID=CAMNT_0048210735 /DNA_START=15 /DNA_END=824 /DNA_ORIENTATION=+
MGRKRNQGKARKAAKAKAKAKEEETEERNNETTTNGRDISESVEAQTRRMQSYTKCKHGYDPFSGDGIGIAFATAFSDAFCETDEDYPIDTRLLVAEEVTMDRYADMWDDSTKMEMAISYLLFMGTQAILAGKYNYARGDDVFVRYFEQYMAVELQQTQALFRTNKLFETQDADLHTLVTFFRKRIPCSCLEEKYQEVKSISKMGMCFNPQCTLPNGMTKRSKTMYCDGCRSITYCSRECQKADWSRHKNDCLNDAERKAEFDAREQNM